jgi:E3 ubiquitin-protein ligase synoviolin
VLLVDLVSNIVRYVFLLVDLWMEGEWQSQGLYTFYNELLSDLCQLTVYVAFFLYVQFFYTFPLHIIRDVYITFTKFQRRFVEFLRYRRVVATMDEDFLNASEEELAQGDRTCIICREEMTAAKKLTCGHMFHYRCLRSWLKRQLSCPTCRSSVDVLDNAAPQAGNGAVGVDANNDANNNEANQNGMAPAPAAGAALPARNIAPAAGQQPVANGGRVAPQVAQPIAVRQVNAWLVNVIQQWWASLVNMAAPGQRGAANPPNPAPQNPQGVPYGYMGAPYYVWRPVVPGAYAYPHPYPPMQYPLQNPHAGASEHDGRPPAHAHSVEAAAAAERATPEAHRISDTGDAHGSATRLAQAQRVEPGGALNRSESVNSASRVHYTTSPSRQAEGQPQASAPDLGVMTDPGLIFERLAALQEHANDMRTEFDRLQRNFEALGHEIVELTCAVGAEVAESRAFSTPQVEQGSNVPGSEVSTAQRRVVDGDGLMHERSAVDVVREDRQRAHDVPDSGSCDHGAGPSDSLPYSASAALQAGEAEALRLRRLEFLSKQEKRDGASTQER